MRNEELGINAVAPLGRVLLCATLPRTEPSADEFCPFRGQVGAKQGRVGMSVAWVVRALRMII